MRATRYINDSPSQCMGTPEFMRWLFVWLKAMRNTDSLFYKSSRWESKRQKILRRDGYMCQYFKRLGKYRPAETVHHIFPRELFPEYQWESWNLISLSNEAHNMMHDRNTHELTKVGKELLLRTARKYRIDTPPSVL